MVTGCVPQQHTLCAVRPVEQELGDKLAVAPWAVLARASGAPCPPPPPDTRCCMVLPSHTALHVFMFDEEHAHSTVLYCGLLTMWGLRQNTCTCPSWHACLDGCLPCFTIRVNARPLQHLRCMSRQGAPVHAASSCLADRGCLTSLDAQVTTVAAQRPVASFVGRLSAVEHG